MTALPVPAHLPLKSVQKVLPHFSLPAPVLQDLPDILSDMPLPPLSKELFLLFLRILLPGRSEMLLKSPPHPQWKYLLILNTVIS